MGYFEGRKGGDIVGVARDEVVLGPELSKSTHITVERPQRHAQAAIPEQIDAVGLRLSGRDGIHFATNKFCGNLFDV
jgi:hypothetical protein